jgi:hypothetical protein
MMPIQKPGRSKQDYETPQAFLDKLPAMTWDLACTEENKKAPHGLTHPTVDGLATDWSTLMGNLWCNPPFGEIAKWAKKASETKVINSLYMLVPASVGANWFRDYVHGKAMVLLLNGRLSFDGKNPFPKDCMLLIYGPGASPVVALWDWRK